MRVRALSITLLLAASWASAEERDSLMRATSPPAEGSLLDVQIAVFEAAPDFFPEVRRAEARYVPVRLREALQESGFWGVVRVMPEPDGTDLTVLGRVVSSSGAELRVEVEAVDATGKRWHRKKYKQKADASAYLGKDRQEDAFQEIYHRIANDLAKKYRKKKPKELERIREVARLRFAGDLAPGVFDGYLDRRKNGRVEIARLPSHEDPMMARVDGIRQRHAMFVDMLDAHYAKLASAMQDSYRGWQSEDHWRREAMDQGPPTAMRSGGRNAPYGVLIAGGSPGEGTLCGTPGLFGGPAAASQDQRRLQEEERKSHLDILRELGESLASDVRPLLVEVEGDLHRLEGSAEAQYVQWRKLLQEIFAEETGLPKLSSLPEASSR